MLPVFEVKKEIPANHREEFVPRRRGFVNRSDD